MSKRKCRIDADADASMSERHGEGFYDKDNSNWPCCLFLSETHSALNIGREQSNGDIVKTILSCSSLVLPLWIFLSIA